MHRRDYVIVRANQGGVSMYNSGSGYLKEPAYYPDNPPEYGSWIWTREGHLRARFWLPFVLLTLWVLYNLSLVVWVIAAATFGDSLSYMELRPTLHALTIWILENLSSI